MIDDPKSRLRPKHKPKAPDQQTRSYEVGYRKPPLETRFQPGRTGNPRGRPKGSMTCKPDPARKLSEVVREESRRPVNLQQGGQTITLPSDQAVVRSITARAIQGNASAQRSFLLLQKELNTPDDVVWKEQLAILIAYKNGWREVLRDSARRHISLPPPDPLPESIEIDEDNRAAYLLAAHEVSSGDCARANLQRRRLGAEDYDWLRRNIPDTENTSALTPQPLLSPEETRRLPYHIRVALWDRSQGYHRLARRKICVRGSTATHL